MPRIKKSKPEKVEEKVEKKVEEKVDGSFRPERVSATVSEKPKPVKKPKKPKKSKKEKEKVKRKPSAYAQFVRDHYKDDDVQALVPKKRFGLIALRWREHKAKSTKSTK